MPYQDDTEDQKNRPSPTSSEGSHTSTNGTGARGNAGVSGETSSRETSSGQSGQPSGLAPGGLAESVAYNGSPQGGMTRDMGQGSPEMMQQQQAMQMMNELKMQYEGVITTLSQLQEQVAQLTATFPAAQESLQPVEQAFTMIGQAIVQSMVTVIQQSQPEPMMPPQV